MMNFSINSLIDSLNSVLDTVAPIILGGGLMIGTLIYTYNRIRADGFGAGVYLGGLALTEAIILLVFLHFLPRYFAIYGDIFGAYMGWEPIGAQVGEIFRWSCIWLIALLYWRHINRKNDKADNENRGVKFIALVLATCALGWLLGRWAGMIFISIPILLIYIHAIYSIAQVLLPASSSENLSDTTRKAWFFLTYLAGVQHPVWVAESSATRDIQKRIDGDSSNGFGKTGIVLTHPHQVTGISINIAFNRVAGPGLIFTRQYEEPVALVDLRKQSRLAEVEAVTKDGMRITVKAVAAFRIDNQSLEHPEYAKLHNTSKRNFKIDHPAGSFPYSSGRVRTALGMTGISQPLRENNKKNETHWDHWVETQTTQAVRQVIAERALDELWHPRDNDRGVSALDEMANDLKKRLEPILIHGGIQLLAARVINFVIKKDDPIVEQNIKTWRSYWDQRIAHTDAETRARHREEIEKAHAYSKSLLLNAIAESITKARKINDKLPRHVIAQYFVHALEEYVKGQPSLNIEESKKRLGAIREILHFHTEDAK